MGCCHSRSATSAAAAEQQHAPLDGVPAGPIPAHDNQPIRPPTPLLKAPKNVCRHQPPWTRSIYENELRGFFETRQGGNAAVWQTLNEVARLTRRGQIHDAQTILDAANLSCPNGRMSRTRSTAQRGSDGHRLRGGIYDIRGQRYDLPSWVLTEPRDLIEEPPASAPEKDIEDDNGTDDDEDPSAHPIAGSDKGKGKAQDPGETMQARIRYNDLTKDAVFMIGNKQPASFLRQQIQEARGTDNVRLILTGQIWEGRQLEKTLEELGWNSTLIINAFVADPSRMN